MGEIPDEEGEDASETLATSLLTVPQSDLHLITDSEIAKLLDTAPALASRTIFYILCKPLLLYKGLQAICFCELLEATRTSFLGILRFIFV